MNILYTLACYIFQLSQSLNLKPRLAFYSVLVLSVMSPLLDLLFFKMLAGAFTNTETLNDNQKLIEFTAILVLLLVTTNIIKYLTRVQRLKYISKMIEIVGIKTNEKIGGSANWLRMVLLEFFNSATAMIQVITLSLCSLYLSLLLGGYLLASVLFSSIIIHYYFTKETLNQRKLHYNKTVNHREKGELTVQSRVKTTELTTVLVNLVFLLFFIALLFNYTTNELGLIFLFLVRFIASSQGLLLSSLMRLSRGWAQVEPRMQLLKESL